MTHTQASTESAPKIDLLVFRQAVRKLWEDHITWTRVYIISALAGLPEADTAAQRLLQNQVDIGNAIKPFYGDPAGDQLTSLLKDRILTAADLLAAAKTWIWRDKSGNIRVMERWHSPLRLLDLSLLQAGRAAQKYGYVEGNCHESSAIEMRVSQNRNGKLTGGHSY